MLLLTFELLFQSYLTSNEVLTADIGRF